MLTSCVTCYDVWTDIIIPLAAALIGGGLTMIGVAWTLRAQKKENNENNRLSVKPLFYGVNAAQGYDSNKTPKYIFVRQGYPGDAQVYGLIRNTDNGILILDKFVASKYEYRPQKTTVIDKNATAYIQINRCSDDNLNVAHLHVRDVLGNEYVYEASVVSYGSTGEEELTEYHEITLTEGKKARKRNRKK